MMAHQRPAARRSFLPALVLGLATLVLAVRLPLGWAAASADRDFLDPIAHVRRAIDQHFHQDPDHPALQRGAIDGLIAALNDPYTEFVPTADIPDFDKQIRGEFVGIGAEVRTDSGFLRIVSPLDDSPALRAGLQAGDLVLAVDGRSVYRMPVDAIIAELTGPPDSLVRLTVQRDAPTRQPDGQAASPPLPPAAEPPTDPAPRPELAEFSMAMAPPPPPPSAIRFDLPITRQRIRTETIRGLVRDGQRWDFFADPSARIAYIRITQFTDTTAPRLTEHCRRLFADDAARALILDLRYNAGGSLLAAIQTADLFLHSGVIVSTVGRTTRPETVRASQSGTLPDFPMIVLLNAESASASEVVAGALADNQRALVLGQRSFGKGLVQAIYTLPRGLGQLKITEQSYALPSGRIIQRRDDDPRWGVDPAPGFFVPMNDEQSRAALRQRQEAEVLRASARPDDPLWSDPDRILEHFQDPQLTAAVRALRDKLRTGEWIPPAGQQPESIAAAHEQRAEQQRLTLLLRELERTQRRLDTLRHAADGTTDPLPLIPAGAPLAGGTLELRAADGTTIATLRITDPSLADWLADAPLAPLHTTPAPAPAPETTP